MSSIDDCLFSSDSNKTSDFHNIISNLADEQGKKCRIDNISHIAVLQDSSNTNHDHPVELEKKLIGCNSRSSESLLEKNDPKEVQKQSTDDYNNSGSEDNWTNPIGNRTLILKNSIAYCSEDDNPCHNTDALEDPHSSSNISSKAQICSGSLMSAYLSHALVNVNGENKIADDDACKDDGEKTPQLVSLGTENCISGFKLQEAIKSMGSKDQPDRPNSNSQTSKVLLQPYFEGEVIAETDDDVKVCDICGDTGQEEFLAICSRCSDVAEHIYCMQIMLAEVPEGDWLCEECQLKEAAAQVTGKFEARVAPTEAQLCLKENCANKEGSVENKTTDPDMKRYNEEPVKVCDICGDTGQEEFLAICSRCNDGAEHTYCMQIMLAEVPEGDWLCEECQLKEAAAQVTGKFEARVAPTEAQLCLEENSANKESSVENKTDPDMRRYNKEPVKSISSKRKEENSEVNSVYKQKLDEAIDTPSGTIFPTKPSQFSCENFNKHDSVKIKPISSTICNKSEGISRTQTSSGLDSSGIQAPLQPTRGPLSKSNSFNNSKLPKVKQLLDNVPWKMKLNRESNLTNKRNDSPSRAISKSATFGSETSGFSSVETSSKAHALSLPHSEDPKQVKGGSMLDKKNSTCDQRFVSPAVSIKADSNEQSCNSKVRKFSDLNNLDGKRRPIDAISSGSSATEVKKTLASLSQTSGTQSLVRLCKNEDQKGFQPTPKATYLTQRDVKAKGQISINSRQLASVPNCLSHCHECNETGHIAQFCPVDKLRMIATKPSSERNLRDMDIRSIKWKNVSEGPAWKSGTKRKSPDQSEEVSLASADVNSEATTLYPSSNDLSSRITNVQNCSKAANTIHVKLVEDHKKFINVPGEGTVLDFPGDVPTKIMAPTLLGQASTPVDLVRASAIPEMDYIWQGAFEVLRTAKPPTIFDGFQAHLSSDVSPKALEVAGQFPCKVQLEEVPRLSSWPLKFHENSPVEDNIAIFFFAKNIDSYENYYWKLLDNILKNDLALVGVIGAMQLLIFPSNLLPGNCQRWNNLFYLWGVFRGSQENSLGDLPGLNKKPSVFSLNMEPATRGLSMQTLSDVCSTVNISNVKNQASSGSDTFPIANASRCSTCSDLQDIPASGKDNEVSNNEQAFVKDTMHQDIPDEVQKKQISCSFPAAYSSRNMSQLSTVCVSRLEPKFQIDIEKLPPEVEDDIYSLDEFTSDPDCRKGHEHLVKSGSTQVGNRVEPSKLVSLNCWQGNDRNIQMLDHFSWESKPNLKCTNPSSLDTIENSSIDLLQPTGDAVLWAGESTCTSLSDEKEHKKMRLDNGGHIDCSSREEISSSILFPKVQFVPSSLPNSSLFYGAMSESSKNAENYFFHVNQGPTCTKADNVIYVSSDDDDDSPKSNIPVLELALGEKRRIAKQEISPLQSQKITERNRQDKLHVPDVVDGDDAPTLLSLSLAFPVSEKAQTAKPNSEVENLLPDTASTCTSSWLFGDYTDL
ncbi:hypothetical protein ZIOFF_029549 [Zingiber officinale]|uniref:PHD-type domain-containing protein n=1 Tax=Zingiber officinale TaxID=94328 RepID=A0A8J5LAP9_ZINOF|nr:hypothetical protein ZIOFF_029549 [Zingiber officinale]